MHKNLGILTHTLMQKKEKNPKNLRMHGLNPHALADLKLGLRFFLL